MQKAESDWLSKLRSRNGISILVFGFVWLTIVDLSFNSASVLVGEMLGRGEYYGIFAVPLLAIYLVQIIIFYFLISRLIRIAHHLAKDLVWLFRNDPGEDGNPQSSRRPPVLDTLAKVDSYLDLLLSAFTSLAFLWMAIVLLPIIQASLNFLVKR